MSEENRGQDEAAEYRSEVREPKRRNRMSWVELFMAAILVCLIGLLALPQAKAAMESHRKASCQSNLKHMGMAFKMFANEAVGEKWPPVSPVPGNWVPAMAQFYPDYCSDLEMFICPSHPDSNEHRFKLRDTAEHPFAEPGDQHRNCVSSRYYVYAGFSMGDDYDAITVHDALLSGDWALMRDSDLASPMPYAVDMLGGVSGSGVVMWDRMTTDPAQVAHRPLGANVLFMDGHVEFMRYDPDDPNPTFPVTYVSAELFEALPTGLSPDCGQ
ncbi:MAG: hypothetical protein GY851_22470 [bacterium]|nr:hypothetical protein [bacterium]